MLGRILTIFKQPALGGSRVAKPHVATHEQKHAGDDKAQDLGENAVLPQRVRRLLLAVEDLNGCHAGLAEDDGSERRRVPK